MTFFNTTEELNKPALDRHNRKQERQILNHMRKHINKPFTAEDIATLFNLPRTSAGRALTNLQQRGLIRKSSSARWKSSYGRSCYAWRAES